MNKYLSENAVENECAESLLNADFGIACKNYSSDKERWDSSHLSRIRKHRNSILFNFLILLLNLTICVIYTIRIQSKCFHIRQAIASPARDVITYEGRQWDLLPVYLANGTLNAEKPSHFNGKPTPELAEAWETLIQHQNIRLQNEELGTFADDESLVKLSDGSGYFATLAVFHGLHCVKRLHHFVHRDNYYAEMSQSEADELLYHTEHCIDWLRQYVQCNADTTIIPFYWGTIQAHPLAVDKAKHQCVSWGPLEKWMEQHSFDPFQPGTLIHPIYVFMEKKEKGTKLGLPSAITYFKTSITQFKVVDPQSELLGYRSNGALGMGVERAVGLGTVLCF